MVTEDDKILRIAVELIRRHSMAPGEWANTHIGRLHPLLSDVLHLTSEEYVLTSALISNVSWYAFTTRRVVSQLAGQMNELDPRAGLKGSFGNFKGYLPGTNNTLGAIPIEVATLTNNLGATLRFEFETGRPSMAPIYATRFWSIKYPVLDKLR
jgi:hypothetical protein